MKELKIFILIILCIFFLAIGSWWRFKEFKESLPKVKLPEFNLPEIKLLPEKKGEIFDKEFVSPDGKLKFEYSSDWLELEKESLEKFNRELIKEEAKILFFANKLNLERAAFASLFVQEWELKKAENLEEILGEMKGEMKEKGIEKEIIKLKIENKEAILEAKYKREGAASFYSKEKIIFEENKFYVITIITLEKDWAEFENEANEILNSAQIIE